MATFWRESAQAGTRASSQEVYSETIRGDPPVAEAHHLRQPLEVVAVVHDPKATWFSGVPGAAIVHAIPSPRG